MTDYPYKAIVPSLLELAAHYINHGWCKSSFAINAERSAVGANNPTAVAWCATGAIQRAAYILFPEDGGEMRYRAYLALSKYLLSTTKQWSVVKWNDVMATSPGEVTTALSNTAQLVRQGVIQSW